MNLKEKLVYGALVSPIALLGLALMLPEAEPTTSKPKEPEKFEITTHSVRNLALSCENKQIKPFLKDPGSFRELGHSYNHNSKVINVTVDYTATNSFGGRVRNSKTCTYTL